MNRPFVPKAQAPADRWCYVTVRRAEGIVDHNRIKLDMDTTRTSVRKTLFGVYGDGDIIWRSESGWGCDYVCRESGMARSND